MFEDRLLFFVSAVLLVLLMFNTPVSIPAAQEDEGLPISAKADKLSVTPIEYIETMMTWPQRRRLSSTLADVEKQ